MPRTKHSARKQVTGGPSRPSRCGGSDDSQERDRPRKRAAHPHSSPSDSSSEESDYEDELEDLEQPEYVAIRTTSHPSRELVGPPSSLLLLRCNLKVMPVASLLNLHFLSAATLKGSVRFP